MYAYLTKTNYMKNIYIYIIYNGHCPKLTEQQILSIQSSFSDGFVAFTSKSLNC
jgi:hypothetical protein